MPTLLRGLALALLCAAPLWGQQQPVTALSDSMYAQEEEKLAAILAGPREFAFQQVLTDVQLVRNEGTDTLATYDIVVSYDPLRYRAPCAGIYPLSFIDQFIFWGRRLALYSSVTAWHAGRFFLWDLSTGHQAWIAMRDARGLERVSTPRTTPPVPRNIRPSWRQRIAAIDGHTDLRTMGRWLRLLHDETRDQLLERHGSGPRPADARRQ